jgi:hypothetical protein
VVEYVLRWEFDYQPISGARILIEGGQYIYIFVLINEKKKSKVNKK